MYILKFWRDGEKYIANHTKYITDFLLYISDKRVTVYDSEICAVEDVCGDTVGKGIVVIGKTSWVI